MADTPGEPPKVDPKATEAKPADTRPAEAKPADAKPGDTAPGAARSAAVKPPVLDLTARDSKPDPSAKATDKKPEAKPADPVTPRPASAATKVDTPSSNAGRPVLAALAGGVLGLAAAYGLAAAGLWPTAPVAPAPEDPRLGQVSASLGELETVTSTTQSELAALNQRLAALETAEPSPVAPAEPVDVAGLEADIAALSGRLDTLAAAPATPAVDPEALSGLQTQLADLGTRLEDLASRVGTAEAGLSALDTAVAETNQTLSTQPADIGAVLQLPLVVSGLETAFSLGRPFETELVALRSAAPDLAIPGPVSAAAPTGLPRPDAIEAELRSVLPAMIAGRPTDPAAGWQQGALDWLGSTIALRPTGEIEGDTPDAVLSRLEAAVARRDFVAADTLMWKLPEPMRAAAGTLPEAIAAQAEAARLVAAIRSGALATGAAQ